MIPVGIIRHRRQLRGALAENALKYPRIDLNDQRHRNGFILFTIATIIILFLSTLGSFEAYHLTESVEFCGTLCHQVMEPEHTAYQNSPHANVLCVECHVGSGASWYVKSKLSGLRQVYKTITKTYPAPIETPIHDLRPARETCEKCHWPQKFYARSLWTNKYFLADSLNTEWNVTLQMKTGPEHSELGLREGIHWHINPAVNIEYISDNDKRELIRYVSYKNLETGETTIFRDDTNPASDSLIAAGTSKMMDCIDCHNRPSHNYKSPTVYVDRELLKGTVSKDIPYIKKAAMAVLYESFSTRDSAYMRIQESISEYYKTNYPDYNESNKAGINNAISSIQAAFSKNNFPAMKVTYDKYPEHIGHLETEGCFRCHNNQFKSENGRVISRDCDLCHTIVGQGIPGKMEFSSLDKSLTFEHPVDIGTAWQEMNCSECHKFLY
jgi:nitrate/TMAO reductase-like tetraheme cytochrome c subunit